MNVEAILKTKGTEVATIAPGAAVSAALDMLRAKSIGAIVVSADGAVPDGILSERDIVRGLAMHGASLLDREVSQVMTRNVITCSPHDKIADLMGLMTERRIRHLPVMRHGRLAGIVSIGDVVKNRLDEIEWEADSLKTYIAGVQ
jgi:CBS domain-containing protein